MKKNDALSKVKSGMVFVDRNPRSTDDLGRRFVLALDTTAKSESKVRAVSWYEFNAAPRLSSITAQRLMNNSLYELHIEA